VPCEAAADSSRLCIHCIYLIEAVDVNGLATIP